jgi:hypothetical protein
MLCRLTLELSGGEAVRLERVVRRSWEANIGLIRTASVGFDGCTALRKGLSSFALRVLGGLTQARYKCA